MYPGNLDCCIYDGTIQHNEVQARQSLNQCDEFVGDGCTASRTRNRCGTLG